MEIGKTFCGRTDVRTDGRTHLSSNLLGHRRGDDLKIGDFRREALATYLGRKFITLSVHLFCLQHVCHDAVRRAGLLATANPCFR